jgi:hypothetical protein
MENRPLELRMYFFVPYNISPIQKSIQCGHAALKYALSYGRFHDNHYIWDFICDYGTWIILDGGTTNSTRDLSGTSKGTLNQIGDSLRENDIEFSWFFEPDLNDALTSLCFLCDERVWDYKDYPDFVDYLINGMSGPSDPKRDNELRMMPVENLIFRYPGTYEEWVKVLGGKKNVFLRELIKGKKLA